MESGTTNENKKIIQILLPFTYQQLNKGVRAELFSSLELNGFLFPVNYLSLVSTQ